MRATRIRAATGRILYGYHVAAVLEACEVQRGEDLGGAIASARLVAPNPVYLEQRPLWLVVPHKGGATIWTIEDLRLTPDYAAMSARLGARVRGGMPAYG